MSYKNARNKCFQDNVLLSGSVHLPPKEENIFSFCTCYVWLIGLAHKTQLLVFLIMLGTSLVVQWLRLHASNAGGARSIPGRGNKIPRPHSAAKKNKIMLYFSYFYRLRKRQTENFPSPLSVLTSNLESLHLFC